MPRFGLQIPNFTFDVPDSQLFDRVVELAQAAEETGYDSVWVMDHLYQLPPLGGGERPMLEGYTLLGALAAKTSRVRLGTLVTGVTYRNPAMLAKIVTTLDVISHGRAILGLGAAWHDVEHHAFGFDFPPPGERLARLEEAVQICRAMFTEETPSFDGRFYKVHEVRNVPRPIQPGGIPIMIGGGGERKTLKLVAKYADYCNFFGDPDTVRNKIAIIKEHCKDAGRDFNDITVSRLATLMISENDEQSAATKDLLTKAAGAQAVATFNIGTEKEIVSQIEELMEAGVEYFIFNLPLSDVSGVRRAGELFSAIH